MNAQTPGVMAGRLSFGNIDDSGEGDAAVDADIGLLVVA